MKIAKTFKLGAVYFGVAWDGLHPVLCTNGGNADIARVVHIPHGNILYAPIDVIYFHICACDWDEFIPRCSACEQSGLPATACYRGAPGHDDGDAPIVHRLWPDFGALRGRTANIIIEARKERDEWKAKHDTQQKLAVLWYEERDAALARIATYAQAVAALEKENAELRKARAKLHMEYCAGIALGDERVAENERLRVAFEAMPAHSRTRACSHNAPCCECDKQELLDALRAAMEMEGKC